PGESWRAINLSLWVGLRGLPGGDSLSRLLSRKRGARTKADLPRLTVRTILLWSDLHFKRTGSWPRADSGPVASAPGGTWCAIAHAMWQGGRGLSRGDTLARLLRRRRGVPRSSGPV